MATNSIDFRYSIPDTSGGSVYTAPLSMYVNGTKQPDFTLTNAYSWYYGSYPFTNSPGSNPHHFYDEAHRLFSTTYPAGTTFKLQVDSGDTASSYTVDFADFEQVGAALSQPSGSVSVTSKGADSSGAADSTAAFNAAISAAGSGGTVWIPPGTYNIPGHISVNNVTVAGAGMWYSTVTGTAPGFYGNSAPSPSTNVHLQNFAIFGNVQERDDSAQVNGIGGALSNSTVSNVWIDHMKVGAWMDGPMDKLSFSGMRIRDTTADGINFHGGVTNSTVTNSDIRNTGDDGIATWADSGLGADANDTISNNTVQDQILANGIAIYGGHDNTVSGNLVQDTGLAQGGGIHVGQRFTSTPVGTTTITGQHPDPRRQPRPELAVRRRRAVVRRQPGRHHRPDQRLERAHRAEPVRGRAVGRGHGQRGQPQQRDHRGHRHLRAPGADRRRGDVHQRHGDRRRRALPGLQLRGRQLHGHRRRRQLRHHRHPGVRPLADAGLPAVPALRCDRQPGRAGLRFGRHRGDQRRADGDGRQPDRVGRGGLLDRGER